MKEPLETSVTIDDVFGVLQAKRVAVAAELAGYLILEVAERADTAGGAVDGRFVFIGEEGSVALVRNKREQRAGDAEASLRTLLSQLMDASGSHTPSLIAVAKGERGTGLPGLVLELEAALIPVNRAAGRRALARLAREVKRVMLGVGRNASIPVAERVNRSSNPSYGSVPPPPSMDPPASERAYQSVVDAREATLVDADAEASAAKVWTAAPHSPATATFDSEEEQTTTKATTIPPAPFEEPLSARQTEPSFAPIMDAARGLDVEAASEAPFDLSIPASKPEPKRDAVDELLLDFEVSKTDGDVSRELKELVGIDATPRTARVASAAVDAANDAVENWLSTMSPAPKLPTREGNRENTRESSVTTEGGAPRGERSLPLPVRANDRELPTMPSRRRLSERTPSAMISSARPTHSRGTTAATFAAVVLILGVGAIAVARLAPKWRAAAGGESLAAAQRTAIPLEAPRCKASLSVSDLPPQAELFWKLGQAPLDIERMPVGARLEFVATTEGHAPKRAVIPAGTAWDTGADGRPRYELAIQLERSHAKPGALDPWPVGEPGNSGGAGAPGTVRVISTPKSAEVWLLAGVGPTAQMDDVKCDTDVELLVAGPSVRKRIRVKATDFARNVQADGATEVRTARTRIQ